MSDSEKLLRGQIYHNRTRQYLAPILNVVLPDTFKLQMNNLISFGRSPKNRMRSSVLAYGINDYEWRNLIKCEKEPLLFVLIDRNGLYNSDKRIYDNRERFQQNLITFLELFRKEEFYVDDYPFLCLNCEVHCLVFHLKGWENSFKYFKQSLYSKMYTDSQLEELNITPKSKRQDTYYVLKRDINQKDIFINKMSERFKIRYKLNPDYKGEYEIPIIWKEETFNYHKKINEKEKTFSISASTAIKKEAVGDI